MREPAAIVTVRTAACLIVIVFAGLVIVWQGWRARGPDADVLASMVRSVALIERGHIPQRGNLTDHNSFRPPGLSWLLAPGVAVFDDPRLVELAACALLYAGTIAGVYALGARLFSHGAALLAAALYAFSAIGVYLAATMQPKAYPFFGVWMAYAVVRWVSSRDSRWLAWACIVCAAGAYVHLEMLALASMIPLVWWMTRAPITLRAFAVVVLVTLVMWAPYLRFQYDRDFVDLQSQVLLQRIAERGPETVALCGEEPTASPRFADSPRDRVSVTARIQSALDLSMLNFSTRVPFGRVILLLLFVAGIVASLRSTPGARALAAATVLPMLIIAVLTEPGVPRMLSLWPLQLLLIVSRFDQLRTAGLRIAAASVVLLIIALNPETMTRVRALPSAGWAGAEPVNIEAAQFRTVRCPDEPATES